MVFTKTSGLGDNLYVQGWDMSGDVGSLSKIGGGPAALDVTGIDKSAMERTGGKRDSSMEFSSWFNPYTAVSPDKMWLLPRTQVIGTYFRGKAVGNEGAACVARQVNWDPTRAADGAMSMACQLLADSFGVEWGTTLTAGKLAVAGGVSGAGYHDAAALTAFGAQAYIQFFSVADNSITVKIQDNATDNAGTYADIPGLTSGAVTTAMCPYAIRVATTNTENIDQWLRIATTGTATNSSIAVLLCRNLIAGQAF